MHTTFYKRLALGIVALSALIVGAQVVSARIANPVFSEYRWIFPYHGANAITSQAFTANRVFTSEFEIPQQATIDQLCYVVGGTSAGNVQMAVYGPVTTEETIVGAPLVTSSASTAQGSINTPQCLSVTEAQVQAGRYYVALQGSDGTGTYMRNSNQTQVVGWTSYHDATYGAFAATATTTTATGSAIPGMKIRLKQ